MAAGARHLVFTINNPVDEPQSLLEKFKPYVKYVIFQEEIGESGTRHYQGYAEFSKQTRYGWCCKHIAPGHYEKRQGSREAARDYCRKADTRVGGPYEYGEWLAAGQGRRSDLDRVVALAREGMGYRQIAREEPEALVKYPRGLRELVQVFAPPREERLTVNLLYGSPGIGKSYFLKHKYGSEAYWKRPGKWFDGYDRHPVIVLDEYRGWLPLAELLTLLDPYDLQVETKGGHVNVYATEIWITTNVHPRDWYSWSGRDDDWPALVRRFHAVYTMEDHELVPLDLASFFL